MGLRDSTQQKSRSEMLEEQQTSRQKAVEERQRFIDEELSKLSYGPERLASGSLRNNLTKGLQGGGKDFGAFTTLSDDDLKRIESQFGPLDFSLDASERSGLANRRSGGASAGVSLNQDTLKRALEKQIRGIEGETASAQEELLGARSEELTGQLKSLKSGLNAQVTATQRAIDAQLANLLNDTGFRADTARATTGEAAAARGLERSTFGQRAVGDITQGELEQKTTQRLQAESQKMAVGQRAEEVGQKLTQAERELRSAKTMAEIKTAQDIGFSFDQNEIQNNLNAELQKLQLDQRQSQVFSNLLGGLGSGLAKIFTGGLF